MKRARMPSPRLMTAVLVFLVGGCLSLGYLFVIDGAFAALARAHEKELHKTATPPGSDQPLGKPPTPVPGPVQPPNGRAHEPLVQTKPPTVQEPKVVPDTRNLKQRTLDLANELDGFVQSRNDYWRDHYPEKNAMTAVQLSQSTDALYRGPINQFPQKVIKIRDEFKVFHIEDEKLNELIDRDEMMQQVRAQNPAGTDLYQQLRHFGNQ